MKKLRSLNRTLSALLFAVGLSLGACGAEVPADPITVVNAELLSKLPAGQSLQVDFSGEKTYVFDYHQGLDFSRISVKTPDGSSIPMAQWLSEYKASTGQDLANQPDKVFRIGDAEPTAGQVGAQCRYCHWHYHSGSNRSRPYWQLVCHG